LFRNDFNGGHLIKREAADWLIRTGGPSPQPLLYVRGTFWSKSRFWIAGTWTGSGGDIMHGIIYLVGLVVVILAILSFFGLR
jgi:hypothetical protein